MSDATGTPFDDFLARIDAGESELRRAAAGGPKGGLTAADPATGERWEAGQVWAHLAEFVPYWIAQARTVIDPPNEEPVKFGRVKTDEGRLSAIERRRTEAVGVLAAATAGDVRALRSFVREVESIPGAWLRTGLHSKLGEMTIVRIVEEFLVGHIEEHLRQLSELGELS